MMKVVILAGGLGSRISEESHLCPKPMIEIGERPIIWHIMKIYSSFGFNEFVICLGYKGQMIKQFFADYYIHMSDVTFDFTSENRMMIHSNVAEPWKVTLVDTGLETQTGGRIARIQKYIGDETFMLTYGDGVSNVDLRALYAHHKKANKFATLTAIQPSGRFGVLSMDEGQSSVKSFVEKAREDGGWINGGFMVLEPQIFHYISGDMCVFEQEPLQRLSADGQLIAYRHTGFWQCMDTQREKFQLEDMWKSGKAKWKIW